MSLQQVVINNRKGWRWGVNGQVFYGPNGKSKASRVNNAFCPTGSGGGQDNSCSSKSESTKSAPINKGDISLAHPMIVLGDLPVRQEKYCDYVEKHGQEFQGSSKMPKGIKRGPMKQCFKNASLLVMDHPELNLSYAEGIAYPPTLPGLGFLHGWAVDSKGTVVDPTWKEDGIKYFGVKYEQKDYLKHLGDTGMYGIFGGDYHVAKEVLERGGL